MEIEKIIADLREQGKSDEEILGIFAEMLEKAKEILQGGEQPTPTEEEEKKQAEEIFGIEF